MASTVFPVASAGKTSFRTMLTSGTSYTVPTGATYLNITTIGGGGGGSAGGNSYNGIPGTGGVVAYSTLTATSGGSIAYAIGAGGVANSDGGTTTFTGATSAAGGKGGNTGGVTAIGMLNAANNMGRGGSGNGSITGGVGAAGSIIIEYWV